jgi:beta-N-acetylhexosaminidase
MTAAESTERRRCALGVLMPGFVGTTLPDWLRSLLEDGLSGICLFGHNVEGPAQLAALTSAIYSANQHAIVSMDEEGGDVSRLHQRDGSPFPGNAVLGRIDDIEATRAVAHEVGAQLADVGIHLTLAPDADVNSNPDNPVIGVRSFGADPVAVAAHTAAWTDGVQAAGVAACAKHFPGHGDTSSDSHVSEPVLMADLSTLSNRELVPFCAAIEAGTKTIMTSHIRVPALDPDTVATFSDIILGDLLRGRLGFDGVIVTDALDMVGASGTCGIPAAAVAAIAAGADLLCLGSNNPEHEISDIVDALVHADLADELPTGRLADAAARCLTLAHWAAGQRQDTATSMDDAVREPIIGTRQVIDSFTMSERAEAVLASGTRPVRWVRIEPERNVAVGTTPLGPFFDGGAVPSLVVPIDDRSLAADYVAEPGELTVVVGRELHRDDGALAAANTIAARSEALIVDMGFAHVDHVDIATFGASRLVGEALLELVEGPA